MLKTKSHESNAFTLIEILVVIAIIGTLSALILPSIIGSSQKQYEVETRAIIENLVSGLESYASMFGDYPPSSLRLLDGVSTTNGLNDGIEAAVACLSTQKKGFQFDVNKEEHYADTDSDTVPTTFNNNSRFQNGRALEIVDAWGNPLVYVRGRDIDSMKPSIMKVKLKDGTAVSFKLPKADITGRVPGSGSYLIWSLGPEGKDEQGGGANISSWKK